MKRVLLAIGLALAAAPAAQAQEDPVLGLWQTEPDEGAFAFVDVHMCGEAICGTITRTFNDEGEYQASTIGAQIIRGMVPNGDGKYRGQVWRPSNDKIYVGKLELSGDRLKMQGCVAGGLICDGQTWLRLQ